MTRRWAGGVVALAVVVFALMTGVASRGLSGGASRIPIPPPPAVGSCLQQPISDTNHLTVPLPSGGPVLVPVGVFGLCSGPHFGEVTAVFPAVETINQHLTDVNSCALANLRFLGVPDQPVAQVPGGNFAWQPVVGDGIEVAGPTAGQRLAGASWLTCIVGAPDGAAFSATAHNSLLTTGLPWDPRTCSEQPSFSAASACAVAHRGQLLGSTVVNPNSGIPDDYVRRTCVTLAGQLLGTQDPTARGRLELQVLKDPVIRAYTSCVLAPTSGRLLASVLGLRNADPPLGS